MDDSESEHEHNRPSTPDAGESSFASARNDFYTEVGEATDAKAPDRRSDRGSDHVPDNSTFRGLGRRLEPYAILAQRLPPDSAELRKRITDIEKCRNLFAAECEHRKEKVEHDHSDNPTRVPSPSQESGLMFCRICRESEENREAFVTPCRCRGSVARVHVSCLERWLAESDTSCCELCGHQYVTIRTPKYNVLSSIPAWLANTSNTDMMFDLAAFCVFTPVALFGTWLGVNAGDNAYLQVIPRQRNSLVKQAFGSKVLFHQMSLMAAIDLVYSAWLAMRLQYHAARWYSWWRRKSVVKVILEDIINQPTPIAEETCIKEPFSET